MRPLIIKTGSTLAPLCRQRGDFEQWFAAGLGLALSELLVVDVRQGSPLPDPRTISGVVISGSPAMVSRLEPWGEATAAWIREAVARGTPLLGVCFGHQLLAYALGGAVAPNPQGPQLGTIEVELTAEGASDPLFAGMPSPLVAQVAHEEIVCRLPPRARLLATAPKDAHHAFAIGENAWGVQFHPEFDARIVRHYLAAREKRLPPGEATRLSGATRDSPHGLAILARFGCWLRERAGDDGRGAPDSLASSV